MQGFKSAVSAPRFLPFYAAVHNTLYGIVSPKIRDEKLWDSKKPRFLMKMSPIYF